MQAVSGRNVQATTSIVMSGIAKVFVGEVIEKARVIQGKRGDWGPLLPIHIREAYEQLKEAGQIPYDKPPLFIARR